MLIRETVAKIIMGGQFIMVDFALLESVFP